MNGLMESLIEKQADEYLELVYRIYKDNNTIDEAVKDAYISGANFILSLMGKITNDLCHVVEFEGKTRIYLHNYIISSNIECSILFTGSLDGCKDYVNNVLKIEC